MIIFFGNRELRVSGAKHAEVPMDKPNKHQKAVIQAVRKVAVGPGAAATVYAVAKELNRSREEEPHVFRDLEGLVAQGYLRRVGCGYCA